jgi:hypothetical protein
MDLDFDDMCDCVVSLGLRDHFFNFLGIIVFIKVDLLAACIALYWLFSFRAPANGNQRPIPEEMPQTLLTDKKQGNLY